MPSDVASGIRKSPCACSPSIRSGPAKPRHLRRAGEILAVALGPVRVERILRQVPKLHAAGFFHKRLPFAHDLGRVVVPLVARNARPAVLVLADGVLHFESHSAKGPRLESDFDVVPALRKFHPIGLHCDRVRTAIDLLHAQSLIGRLRERQQGKYDRLIGRVEGPRSGEVK